MERWSQEGLSNRDVAKILDKAPQTIHNEVKRGFVRQQVRKGKFEVVYRTDKAKTAYNENRTESVRQITLI